MKRTITALLIGLMLICCTNITALAVTTPSPGETLSINDDSVQITQAGTYTITGTGVTTNTITVDPNIVGDVNITLSGVNIDVHATDNACAFLIGHNTKVNLTLTDSTVNTLISGKNMAGLKVPSNAALNIDGTGTLNVQGGLNAAGIGGAGIGELADKENGSITINSGIINAIGGANCIHDFSGAGIGAGYGKRVECGLITINGGTIDATGGGGAAGIGGGGWQSKVSTITITDGTVTVRSNNGGAGIGSGYDAINSGTVIISGGIVNAYGANGGAAIGGGHSSHGGVVTISGGVVRALSNNNGAGIGGGQRSMHGGNGGAVAISGGEVYVESLGAMSIGAGLGGTNEGTLKIFRPSAIFIKGHKNIAMLSMQNAYNYVSSETITSSSANGYTNFPSAWNGEKAYGYIPATIASFNVNFNSQSGSSVNSQIVDEGATAAKPSDPTRTGYTFGGWYTNNSCNDGDEWNFAHCTIAQDIILYAKWTAIPVTPTYTVAFDAQGGSDVSSQTVDEGDKATKPSTPTRSGYTFGGWYTDNGCNDGDEWNFNVCTVFHDTTLYAKWIKQTGISVAQITFDNAYSALKPQTQKSLKDICPYTITPSNASCLSVTWTSSNTDVATISDGKINTMSEGKTIITATANDTANGTLISKMIVEVMDSTATGLETNGRSITGTIQDNSGNVLAGYGITLYSIPQNALSDDENGFAFNEVPFEHHTLVVSNTHGEEIGRFRLNFNNTGSQAYSFDNTEKTADIDYASYTTGINLAIRLNAAESDIRIADININGDEKVINPNTGGIVNNEDAVDGNSISTDAHSGWTTVFYVLLRILIYVAVTSATLVVIYILVKRKLKHSTTN